MAASKKPSRSKIVKNLDAIFSQYIRKKDAVNEISTCFTCGKEEHWKKFLEHQKTSEWKNLDRYSDVKQFFGDDHWMKFGDGFSEWNEELKFGEVKEVFEKVAAIDQPNSNMSKEGGFVYYQDKGHIKGSSEDPYIYETSITDNVYDWWNLVDNITYGLSDSPEDVLNAKREEGYESWRGVLPEYIFDDNYDLELYNFFLHHSILM